MEGLTLAKTTCEDFVSLIAKHDIICLVESWTTKKSSIELDGYKTLAHSFRRAVNRRAKRAGGGVIIYIKEELFKGVKLVKNAQDCIVWLKLDKIYFGLEKDIYLGITYIVPENSPIHALYDVDLFQTLEEDVFFFSEKGDVFLTGDLNARSGNKRDFIEILNGRSDETLGTSRIPVPRVSQDKTVNRFGELLLDMCKSTDMRIVNGRLHNDAQVGSFTCMTANGESLVDYLLTSYENFNIIHDFKILPFNEFSNHAPLFFSIATQVYESQRETTQEWHSTRWNEVNKDTFRVCLSEGLPACMEKLENLQGDISQDKINTISSVITDCITNAADSLFNKKHSISRKPKFNQRQGETKDRAAWYDNDCRIKKSTVKKCLDTYNRNRTTVNREAVLNARKDYKYTCRKRKLKFQRERCLKWMKFVEITQKIFGNFLRKKRVPHPARVIYRLISFLNILEI